MDSSTILALLLAARGASSPEHAHDAMSRILSGEASDGTDAADGGEGDGGSVDETEETSPEEEEPSAPAVSKSAHYDASKHPRGQPGNAGQFGPGGASKPGVATTPEPTRPEPAKPAPTPDLPATRRTDAPEPPRPRTNEPAELPATIRPDSPAAHSPRQRRSSLEKSPVAGSLDLGGGCNETRLLELADGTQGVFKPAAGEQHGMRDGVTGGTYWRREIAASDVAEILGFGDLVPTTTYRKVEHPYPEEGSIQQYVGGADNAIKLPEGERYDGDEDASRAAAFDYLIGHLDRHEGNWMLGATDGSKKLVLIDNGLAFPHKYEMRDFFNMRLLRHAVGKDMPLPDMTHLADMWPDVEESLRKSGIEDSAIALTRRRFASLTSGQYSKLSDLPSLLGGYADLGDMASQLQRNRKATQVQRRGKGADVEVQKTAADLETAWDDNEDPGDWEPLSEPVEKAAADWTQHTTTRGKNKDKQGWKNTKTGKIVYQGHAPGSEKKPKGEASEKAKPQSAAERKAQEVADVHSLIEAKGDPAAIVAKLASMPKPSLEKVAETVGLKPKASWSPGKLREAIEGKLRGPKGKEEAKTEPVAATPTADPRHAQAHDVLSKILGPEMEKLDLSDHEAVKAALSKALGGEKPASAAAKEPTDDPRKGSEADRAGKAFLAAFPGGKEATPGSGEYEATIGTRLMTMQVRESEVGGTPAVNIDFANTSKSGLGAQEIPASLRAGSLDVMRGLKLLVDRLGAAGVPIEFTADPHHLRVYKRSLEAAGYRNVHSEEMGEGYSAGTRLERWEPPAEKPTPTPEKEPATTTVDPATLKAAVADATRFWSGDKDSYSYGDVRAFNAKLEAFDHPALLAVADAVKWKGGEETSADKLRKAIQNRLISIKGTHDRSGMYMSATERAKDKPKPPPKDKPTGDDPVASALAAIQHIDDTSLDPTRSADMRSEIAAVAGHLAAADLKDLARRFGIARKPKNKEEALGFIAERIAGRRGAFERSSSGPMGGVPDKPSDADTSDLRPAVPDYAALPTPADRHKARYDHEQHLAEWGKRQYDSEQKQRAAFTGKDNYGRDWRGGKIVAGKPPAFVPKPEPKLEPQTPSAATEPPRSTPVVNPQPRPPKPPPRKVEPLPNLSVATAGTHIQRLYDNALAPDMTEEKIHDEVRRIASLPKAQIDEVVRNFGMVRKFTSKEDAINAIARRIVDRRGAYHRSQV